MKERRLAAVHSIDVLVCEKSTFEMSGENSAMGASILCLSVCDVMGQGWPVWHGCLLCHEPASFCPSFVKGESVRQRLDEMKIRKQKSTTVAFICNMLSS